MYSVYKKTEYGMDLQFMVYKLDDVFARLSLLEWYPYVGYYVYAGSLEQDEAYRKVINGEKKGASQ